ncbi:MAG: NADP-dependent malic enzyme [Hyphomicrobiales bacterium]
MDQLLKRDALNYHASGRPGKIEVIPTKPHSTQRDLSLAYSPGVAEPCLEIQKHPEDAYKFTGKGNLVAVISNGTAVLGLGNIGAQASKPVMEGKGLLFKIYSDIDVFDIEVNEPNVDKFVEIVKAIAPTFGGINLEDIKAPECFEIERRLKEELNIPIMHDDQHGTAIISSAGLINALLINGKNIEDVKIVVNGAGAASVSCTRLYIKLGARPENIIMLDSRGVLRRDRTDLNPIKQEFITDQNFHQLEDAIVGADVFLGLSKGDVLTPEMLKSMANDPIVFALANPTPEIDYNLAIETRKDIIIGTGRSDFPNQVNNVLGFPYIFRGALDVRATEINEEMKLAASKALAKLARKPVPTEVNMTYKDNTISFGKDYLIPKPTDPRLLETVAPAVAQAAIESNVAGVCIVNMDEYKESLRHRIGLANPLIEQLKARAQRDPKKVIFSEAQRFEILKAAEVVANEGIAAPILLGNRKRILELIKVNEIALDNVEIIDPREDKELERKHKFADILFNKRQRKGMSLTAARDLVQHRNYFAPMLVETGYADAVIGGLTRSYPDTIRPALESVGRAENSNVVSGMYIFNTKKGPVFFSDCTVNIQPTAEELVEITLQTADKIKELNFTPRIALVSYSNFGSNRGEGTQAIRDAIKILHRDYPDLIVEGEMQANIALNKELLMQNFPFSKLGDVPANTLIFPNLSSANIAYKLMIELGNFDVIGPVLNGLNKSVHVLQMGSTVKEIVNMVLISVIDAQCKKDCVFIDDTTEPRVSVKGI